MSGQRISNEELRRLLLVRCPECTRALPITEFRRTLRTGDWRKDQCIQCKDGRGGQR